MLKCFATLLLVTAAVSGCYFPSNFTADLQIDRQGRYRFTYIGKLTDVSMARQLSLGRLQGLGLQKRVEIAERDMRRDSAFKHGGVLLDLGSDGVRNAAVVGHRELDRRDDPLVVVVEEGVGAEVLVAGLDPRAGGAADGQLALRSGRGGRRCR